MDEIVVAILAKDKAYCLPFYLNCLLNQTFDKKRTALYIRSNDNKDETEQILKDFILEHGPKYRTVYACFDSVDEKLKKYEEHEWNAERFNILGKLRQESVDFAKKRAAHYFVADCDNFITKDTLQSLYNDRHLGVIGPLLRLTDQHYYANYHNVACPSGYFQQNDAYYPILFREVKGKIEVDTLHCTYFISKEVTQAISYDDGSGRYEYAIFSDHLRKLGIKQYLDNSKFYGFLFLNDQIPVDFHDYINEYWADEYAEMNRI